MKYEHARCYFYHALFLLSHFGRVDKKRAKKQENTEIRIKRVTSEQQQPAGRQSRKEKNGNT